MNPHATARRNRGRPYEGRVLTFRVKLTHDERKLIDQWAEECGCTPSQYVRRKLFEEGR